MSPSSVPLAEVPSIDLPDQGEACFGCAGLVVSNSSARGFARIPVSSLLESLLPETAAVEMKPVSHQLADAAHHSFGKLLILLQRRGARI